MPNVIIAHWVFASDNPYLSPPKKAVLSALAYACAHNSCCIAEASINQLMRMTAYKRTAIKDALKSLHDDGFITIESMPGCSNIYHIHLARLIPSRPDDEPLTFSQRFSLR